ncbi:MAG: TolC family protein [Bdellovibrionales bacterium]|nr:TolC family protein [Bdellovibrionales bacterium]
MRHALWFFVLVSSHGAAAEAPGARLETLKDALEYGLRHSPGMNSTDRARAVATLERKNALAKLLPAIDLSAKHGIQKSSPSTRTEPWYGELSASLTENLYDNGASLTELSIARLKEDLADVRFRKKRDRFLADTAKAWFQYLKAEESLRIQGEQLQLLRKQYAALSSDYRQGLKLRKDYVRFRTQVSRAEIQETNFRVAREEARNGLLKILGVAPESWNRTTVSVPSLPRAGKAEEDHEWKALMVENHWEWRIIRLQREIDEKEVNLEIRKFWPRATLSSGVKYSSADYLAPGASVKKNDRWDWNALLTLEYNFLDWGTRSRNVEIAREKQRISSNTLHDQALEAKTETESVVLQLLRLRKNYRSALDLRSLEESNTSMMETEYRQGRVAYLDLINSYQDLASARRAYVEAVYDLKQAALEYRYHEGTLYDSVFH